MDTNAGVFKISKKHLIYFTDCLEETIRNKKFFWIGLVFPRLIVIYMKISSHFIRSMFVNV